MKEGQGKLLLLGLGTPCPLDVQEGENFGKLTEEGVQLTAADTCLFVSRCREFNCRTALNTFAVSNLRAKSFFCTILYRKGNIILKYTVYDFFPNILFACFPLFCSSAIFTAG